MYYTEIRYHTCILQKQLPVFNSVKQAAAAVYTDNIVSGSIKMVFTLQMEFTIQMLFTLQREVTIQMEFTIVLTSDEKSLIIQSF